MLDISKIPPFVLDDLKEYVDPHKDLDERHVLNLICRMSAEEAFNAFLIWNGIIGFTLSITQALDSLRSAARVFVPCPACWDLRKKSSIEVQSCSMCNNTGSVEVTKGA